MTEHTVRVDGGPEVSALLVRPPGARALYVLAHGAGAGMRHPFLAAMADALGTRGIATLRYQFPYLEQKRRRPDAPRLLEATVRAAVALAAELAPDLPRVAGGKSMGGRMTSQAAASSALPGVRGLAFLGFPLHPPNQPGDARGAHLVEVTVPMLFLQGTRDAFADPARLGPICERLGDRATLHRIEGADHSFHVPKASGRTDADVIAELAATIAEWATALV